MKAIDYNKILDRYNHFQECILFDYWSEDLCRTFTVLTSNISNPDGTLRDDIDIHAPVYLRFQQCQRILIENKFAQYMLDYPEDIDWGPSEFWEIHASDLEDRLIRFKIAWTTDRVIEIDCYSLQIEEIPNTPEFQAKYAWPYLRPA